MLSTRTSSTQGNILVVNDVLESLQFLSSVLTEQGYAVRLVRNGTVALRTAHSESPDLIVLDITMPDLDGYQVCQQLKQSVVTREIPVILSSAVAEGLDKVKAFRVGAADYITQPFQTEELLARVENQLTIVRQRSSLQQQAAQLEREIQERQRTEETLRQIADQERASAKVIQRIRQTLDIETIFSATTQELRQLINCDRVAIYRFNSDWSGAFVAESVGGNWVSLLRQQHNHPSFTTHTLDDSGCPIKTLSSTDDWVQDTYLQETQGGVYRRGTSYSAVEDIYRAEFSSCYINLLERFQARAYITVPIFCGSQLWGLLASYQNSGCRQWTSAEIKIVVQIGNQLGVALQQAELLKETQLQSAALQAAVSAADAANHAKSEFLASMSHELRTPLNAIMGFTQVMNRDSSLSTKHQQYLDIINRAGEHLLELINDV
ncbi:MAG TPA: response regulator, partial [Coleofasciculaceae cyanobacterium]